VASGVGADEHAPVVPLHESCLAAHLDGLAGQPGARLVGGGGEADGALTLTRRVVTASDVLAVSTGGDIGDDAGVGAAAA